MPIEFDDDDRYRARKMFGLTGHCPEEVLARAVMRHGQIDGDPADLSTGTVRFLITLACALEHGAPITPHTPISTIEQQAKDATGVAIQHLDRHTAAQVLAAIAPTARMPAMEAQQIAPASRALVRRALPELGRRILISVRSELPESGYEGGFGDRPKLDEYDELAWRNDLL